MDSPNFWEWVLGAAGGVGGWFTTTMWYAIRDIERDLADHKKEVAKEYATNVDLQRIDDKLDRILERLPAKP